MAILSSQYIGQDFTAAANALQGNTASNLAGQATLGTASQNNPLVTVTDPALASALAKLAGRAVPGTAAAIPSSDKEAPSYQFIAGWILLIIILSAAAQTRIGYVIIYYSLMLMILLILVTEYAQITPILDSIQTIGMFNSNAKNAS